MRLRDKSNYIQILMQGYDKGFVSAQRILEELDLDYDTEIQRLREEQQMVSATGMMMGQKGGAGGAAVPPSCERDGAVTPSLSRSLLVPGVMTVVMLATLVALGTWQVNRLVWKRDLLAAIAERREPLCGPEAGRETVELTLAVFASFAAGGAKVTLPLAERGHPLK
jgi:hypothetical protein